MQKYRLAVIGGGAAGLLGAVRAGQLIGGRHVVVLEAGPRVGRKLLATGNGHCNLTNLHVAPAQYYGDVAAAAPLLALYSPQRIIGYFQSLGLLCRVQTEGRVYPYSNQASTVLNILRENLQAHGVEERCGFPMKQIRRKEGGFLLTAVDGAQVYAQRVLLCTGGAAQTGTMSGYTIARQLGHTVTPLHAGLAPVEVQETKRIRALKGVRAQAAVTLWRGKKRLAHTEGEVQFTERALSGICIFTFSRMVQSGDVIALDLVPDYTLPRLRELTGGSLDGVLHKALARACPFDQCKDFRFTVAQVAPLRQAQITAGGVPLAQLDARCGSLRSPGAWLAGEILNLDGKCGGFNLHWAWTTALAAAEAIAKEENQ